MKSGIHPTFYPDAVVVCACGNTWTTGSTKKEIHTDVCSACHPFFTGEQRIVDTAGQVERFMKRISAKEQIAAQQPALEEKRSKKEKRRERHAGTPAPAPAPLQPPSELPLAVVPEEAPQAQVETAPTAEVPETRTETRVEEAAPAAQVEVTRIEQVAPAAQVEVTRVEEAAPAAQVEVTHVEQVAPAVTVQEVRPEENVIVPPAMQIGEAASIDKVVQVTEGGERQVAALHDEKPSEPHEAPRGTEETAQGGTAEVRDHVADVEMPGAPPEGKATRKPRAPRQAKPGEKPRSAPRKSAPSKPKKEQS